ncbi:MAG TPA: hypothetical protein VM432_00160 [Bdellovibrionales bacterium]|nr:hypothetical protein [Bdellovibrionales bacterium]
MRSTVLLCFVVFWSGAVFATDWSQPPLLCIEEVVPRVPDRPCLDLSKVAEPSKDFPADISEADRKYWTSQKFGLGYCRSLEVLRREERTPGSQKPSLVELSWMRAIAVNNYDTKVAAIYEAALKYKMPPHVLTGALYQESIFAELGVANDGGNFSCGVAQINLTEWCNWANKQSAAKKAEMGWPAKVACSEVPSALIKPFYQIALSRLNGLPEYRLQPEHFEDIPFDQVSADISGTFEQKQIRYQAARSFLDHCGSLVDAITAKANELSVLYTGFVPKGLKDSERYMVGEKFGRQCLQESSSGTYPLHTGWMLAVGSYNAGPRAVDIMAAGKNWTRADVAQASTFAGFNPKELVSAIYKAGTYNKEIDAVEMNDLSGKPIRVKWMKMCVLQRHIARVVQHVTQPGVPVLADTLEGSLGCNVIPNER